MRRGSVHFLLPMGAIQNDAGYEDRGHRRGIELPIVGHPFPQDGIVQPGDIPQAQFRSIAIVQPSHGRPHGFESFRAKRQTATDRGRDRLSPTPPSGRVGDWRAGLEQFSIKSKRPRHCERPPGQRARGEAIQQDVGRSTIPWIALMSFVKGSDAPSRFRFRGGRSDGVG